MRDCFTGPLIDNRGIETGGRFPGAFVLLRLIRADFVGIAWLGVEAEGDIA